MPRLNLKNKNCQKCRLAINRKQVVNGLGPQNPQLFIIGEAPREEEDEHRKCTNCKQEGQFETCPKCRQKATENGKPFIGGAGRVLSSLLHSANIKRTDCFITNTIRCRPPNNRNPQQDEIEACKEFLQAELSYTNPERVVAVGSFASNLLTGLSVTKWRGCIVDSKPEFGSRKTLITFHPSYIMQGEQRMYSVVVNDFQKMFKEWKEPAISYRSNPSRDYIKLFFQNALSSPTSVDIETTGGDKEESEKGLNPFADEIIGIGFCPYPGQAMTLSGRCMKQNWDLIKEFLENPLGRFIIQTKGTFDNTFLNINNINFKHWWNTATGIHLINPALPKKLEFLRSIWTNMPPYKYKYSIPSSLSEIDLGTYNCLDVDITKRVQEGQEDDLEQSGQLNLMNSCMKGEHAAMKMRLRGVYVNKDKLVKEFARIRPRVEKLAKEFRELYNCDIASPKQVSELLYHTMNFMVPTRAKRGKSWPSVDEKALTELLTYCIGESKEKKCLDTVIAYREIAKTDSTYLTGIYKQIHSDNRLHPDWIPNGPDTGRWACKAPDLQNVPKWLRRIYTPEGDKVFYAGDYNRLELWIGQILSGDEELGRVLETEDIHGIILEEILRTSNFLQNEVPAQQRLKAKAVVFGGIYGKEAKNLAGELKIPRQVVEAWYEIFYGRFPMLKLFLDKLVSDWKRDGFLKTPFGRIKYCEKDTEAKNFPFQSCAGQVTENAIIALEENGFNTILQVHDQILVEESDDTRFKEFQDIMELSTPMLKKRFPVEAKLGYDWEAVS